MAGGAALVLGAVAGLALEISTRTIGLIMGFGAGVLISAVSFKGGKRKSSRGEQSAGAAQGTAIGALMDGIPESLTIGISLLGGGAVGLPVVVAVFLSNIPNRFRRRRAWARRADPRAGSPSPRAPSSPCRPARCFPKQSRTPARRSAS